MHGRIKVKTPKELRAEKEREEKLLAKRFKEDLDKAFEKRKNGCFDEEAFKLTAKLLLQNADFSVLWNFRREIILHWKAHGVMKEAGNPCKDGGDVAPKVTNIDDVNEQPAKESSSLEDSVKPEELNVESEEEKSKKKAIEMEKTYSEELKFTSACLMKHPKSYSSWHQRRYIIKLMAHPPFQEEIKACDHFLDLDERNFHCWDYRRFICEYGRVDLKDELEFTKKKISQNFSNFTSFYYRTTLLSQAHREKILNLADVWDSEYETVANAIFVDPNDQSPWFYHKWLVAADQFITYQQPQPKTLLQRILWDQANFRIVYQFHQFLRKPPFDEVFIIETTGQSSALSNIKWQSLGAISSDIWFHKIDQEKISGLSFKYHGKDYKIEFQDMGENSQLHVNVISELPRGKNLNPDSKLDGEKISNLKLLLELEPDNKWINLTMAMITGGPDEKAFDKLQKIDPLRRNYYLDQKTKQILERDLKDRGKTTKLLLPERHLTCLYFANHLAHLRYLDLTSNDFVKLSTSFNHLISLQTLIMDNNLVSSLDEGLKLLSLKVLSLKHNRITRMSSLGPCNNFPLLETLDITGIEILEDDGFQLSSQIKILKESPNVNS